MQIDEGGEGGVDLAFGVGLQEIELHPLCARRYADRARQGVDVRVGSSKSRAPSVARARPAADASAPAAYRSVDEPVV
jgi:hypothetical protein